jgi:flagellar basal-body rod protein FlgF
MQSAFYVSLSAQMSLDRRMETIADNIANAGTVGYRAAGVRFSSVLSETGSTPVSYASPGRDFISRTSGEVVRTDNPYDVSVVGEAWLAIQTREGTAYTRDGRMQMSETGNLETISGLPVLDAGNSPIVLDPTAGPPMISKDGMITQNGQQIGAIGLFSIDENAFLRRSENSSVVPSQPATPVLNFVRNGLMQGYVEGANINPVHEMTKLILASRSFESMSSMNDLMDSTQRNALRTLGGST